LAWGGKRPGGVLAPRAFPPGPDRRRALFLEGMERGRGGGGGGTVGEKLWGLAMGRGPGNLKHQVLCVTHLPQLASFGDVHLRVEKHVERRDGRDRTVTRLKTLDAAERVVELANMLGGTGDAVSRSAEEILEQVAARKSERAANRV